MTFPGADDPLLDFQSMTAQCGLMLQAPVPLEADLESLRRDVAAVDAAVPRERRCFSPFDPDWTAIPLMIRGNEERRPVPLPPLALMPAVGRLLAEIGLAVVGLDLLRQSPGATLPWHWDAQAPHQPETRLLLPIHAPDGARTLLGHEVAAYPAGIWWTGDFTQAHQVENFTGAERIVLCLDVRTDAALLRLIPPRLAENAPLRRTLSLAGQGAVLVWRSHPSLAHPMAIT